MTANLRRYLSAGLSAAAVSCFLFLALDGGTAKSVLMAFLAGGMFAEALRQLVPRRDPEAVAKRAE